MLRAAALIEKNSIFRARKRSRKKKPIASRAEPHSQAVNRINSKIILQPPLLALPDHMRQESYDDQEHCRRHKKAKCRYAIDGAQSIVKQVNHIAEKYGKLHLRKIVHTITS